MFGKLKFNCFDIFVALFCVAFGLICFYPMWYVFIVSIMPYKTFLTTTVFLLPPADATVEFYTAIINNNLFRNAIFISFAKTAMGATGAIVVTGMLAYGVSKKHIKGMKIINYMVVFTMFFSGGLIPQYLLYQRLHLIGKFWVMVIPFFVSVGNFVIMRNYFSYSVSSELEDAAAIDGANEFIMFFKVIIPLSMPMISAIFLFEAVGQWNDYASYLFYVDNVKLQPFIWVLRRLLIDPNLINQGQNQSGSNNAMRSIAYIPPVPLKMATIISAMLPIMLVYPFLQKYFAKGIMIGALKE